jgi:outer membrane protein OmpA-like peptidoglycan-associated protein
VTRGYGQANPVAPNDTAQNRQLNRRVEIVLSDDGGKVSQR